MSHGDIQHTSIHNDTSVVKESNMLTMMEFDYSYGKRKDKMKK